MKEDDVALKEDDEVWVSFSVGKSFRFLAAHEMARALDLNRAQALPMFHALTGCDNGKKREWTIWTAFPALTQALVDLSTAPNDVGEDAMQTIERFVILLFDKASTSTHIYRY